MTDLKESKKRLRVAKPLSQQEVIKTLLTLDMWEEANKNKKTRWLALCHGHNHRDILQYVPPKLRGDAAFFMIDKMSKNNPDVVMDLEVDLEDFSKGFLLPTFDGIIWCYPPKQFIFNNKLHESIYKMVKPKGYLLSAYLTDRKKNPTLFTIGQHEDLIKVTLVTNSIYTLKRAKASMIALDKIADTQEYQQHLTMMIAGVNELLG
jgi:hypothetical protein